MALYAVKSSLPAKFCLIIIFFLPVPVFFSCGLDTYIVMRNPETVVHSPSYDTTDYAERYFEFRTNEDTGSFYPDDFVFIGTDVYYKIYNNISTLNSERSTLVSLSNSTSSANAPVKMTDPESSGGYGYQPLRCAQRRDSVLIPARPGSNQSVFIRLTDYLTMDDFAARIMVDDVPLGGGSSSVPIRNLDARTFNFGRSGNESNKIPASGDLDVKFSSSATEEGCWYVAMFAVGVGRDVTYTTYYSNILYLGTVTITEGSEYN